jgi:CheY-like chemotaxis protein
MPSVLIIDDEPNIRRMVGALLSAEGYEVRDAPDGVTGLSRAAESDPDVLLLDLTMPWRAGWYGDAGANARDVARCAGGDDERTRRPE